MACSSPSQHLYCITNPCRLIMPSLLISSPLSKDINMGSEDGVTSVENSADLSTSTGSSSSDEARIEWLRSQLIGGDMMFETPFGERKLTYADHTASGRCLQYIEDYIIEQVLPFYGNTHTNDSFVGDKTTKMVREATEYIKRCMGAGSGDALLFCGSGTTACIKRLQEIMGIAVCSIMRDRILESLRDEERWVVFVGPYEHHSNILSWRQSLAEVVEIGVDGDGLIDMEALRAELESPKYASRPMLGSFSACSNVTGILSDTRALARLLHSHGAFACFDFAASGPYVDIDMRSGDIEGYDAVFLSPHKLVGGPGTPGILLMNKSLYQLRDSPPSTCGGGTVGYVNGFNEKDTVYHDDIEEREDAGTPPIIQKIRAALAFWVKEHIGHELIDLCESVYLDTALKRLLPNPNICVLGNSSVRRLPILSFLVHPNDNSSNEMEYEFSNGNGGCLQGNRQNRKGKPLNGRFVAKLMNDLFGIQARGGCACAGPYGHYLLGIDERLSLRIRDLIQQGYNGLKPGWTRISFSYYMTKDEVAFTLDCLEFIAAYGHRFLPLYEFDWVTGDWTFKRRAFKHHLMKEDLTIAASDSTALRPGETEGNKKGSKISGPGNRFRRYLESARHIVHCLPAHYQATSVPEDIDPSVVLFRL